MADYEILTDLRQRHLEAWELAYQPGEPKPGGLAVSSGRMVRACIEAGIVEGLTADDVGDMTIDDANKLAEELATIVSPFYQELTTA